MQTDPESESENKELLHLAPGDAAPDGSRDLTAEQVRQGHTGDHLRYIRVISFRIAAALLLLALLLWT